MNRRHLVLAGSALLLLLPLGCGLGRPSLPGQSQSTSSAQPPKPALGTAPRTSNDAAAQLPLKDVPALLQSAKAVHEAVRS